MSQQKLGRALGVTFQQVQKYEKGVNRIGAGALHQIASALGVAVDYFYEGAPPAAGDGQGFAEAQVPYEVEILSAPEGLTVLRAYKRVKDSRVRRRLLDLIQSLGDADEETADRSV
jgi:transcriptional regulator with XRE-family HTH domain